MNTFHYIQNLSGLIEDRGENAVIPFFHSSTVCHILQNGMSLTIRQTSAREQLSGTGSSEW
jgi:hypothetical protein